MKNYSSDSRQDRRSCAFGDSIIGGRDEQQDAFLILDAQDTQTGDSGQLLILADGMGGHSGGKEASTLAVDAFARRFAEHSGSLPARLRDALDAANSAIARRISENPRLKGMGCTIIGAFVTDTQATWISVGDSPMYLFEPDALKRVNQDHSMAPQIDREVELGKRSAESARNDPARHGLLSAVAGRAINLIDEGVTHFGPDSKLVLASDGLDTLEHSQVYESLSKKATPAKAVANLLTTLEDIMASDQDNTTIIVFQPDAHANDTGHHGARKSLWPIVLFGLACFAVAIAAITFLVVSGNNQPPAPATDMPPAQQTSSAPDAAGSPAATDEREVGALAPATQPGSREATGSDSEPATIPLEGIRRFNENGGANSTPVNRPRAPANARPSPRPTPAPATTEPADTPEQEDDAGGADSDGEQDAESPPPASPGDTDDAEADSGQSAAPESAPDGEGEDTTTRP